MTNRNHPKIIRSSSKDLQESAHPSGDERASMRQTAKNNEMSRHDYNNQQTSDQEKIRGN